MGNSYAGQLKTTRFEEVLHNSIEASLRSNNLVPRPVFSQLYLEAEQHLSCLEGGRFDNDDEDEDDDGSGSSSPTHSYQNKPPPEGCCTTDGFCQAGKDLRLATVCTEQFDVPPGFLLVGAKSPSLPDHILVCAVDKRFLPDDNGRNALLGFSGNCVGCGEKGFRYFTEFSNHINLKLTTQPKKQKHLKYYLVRNTQGCLTKGALISWKGTEVRSRHSSSSMCSSTGLALQDTTNPMASKLSDPALHMTSTNSLAGDNGYIQAHTGVSYQNVNGTCCTQQSTKMNPAAAKPVVLGNVTNSGPPKKRHKGWSPESPTSTDSGFTQNCTNTCGKADSLSQLCAPPSTPGNVLSSPLVATGEPVSIPDNLFKSCMITPVIFKGHGNFPYLCGNVSDVIVSPLLYNCYKNSQSIPKTYEQYGPTAIQPISEEMQLLLTVYYLVQLAPDQVPLIEDLEQIFMRSWRETHLAEIRQYQQTMSQAFPHFPNPITAVTASQLPWLAGLAASSCNESVKIIECSYSLAEGLSEMFKLLVEGKLTKTNYVVIICTSRPNCIDSCIAITGKYQSRVLMESMYTPAEFLKEVNYELVSGKLESLGSFFSNLCPDGDIDVLLDKYCQENHGISSSTTQKPSVDARPATCTSYNLEWHQLRPSQLAVAQKLLSHVCSIADSSTQNLDLGSFEKVEFLICVPPSEVTYQQTLSHVWNSGVLAEIGLERKQLTKSCLEQYVMKLDSEAPNKFKAFLQKAMQNPHTLYVLIHDHAHWDLTSSLYSPYPQNESSNGLVDRLLNCREVKDSPNILILHVTSCPYTLQTQTTRISPYNEIHWPSSHSHGMDLYHEKRKYFGLSQYIESTLSGHSLPLLRHDSSFEGIVMALGKRFPKIHSAMIRTFLLIQHYSSAMMAVCGFSQMKNYTSVETLEIVQNLLQSPKQCANGHGLMVLLRIPCIPLATLAYERLCNVRERLGLQYGFEVILGKANSSFTIGKHFVDQLKVWQKIEDEDWQPRTYLELEGLPCILICSGMEPLGESLPRSLRYCDLRLVQFSTWERTRVEQEMGFASCFIDSMMSQDQGLGRKMMMDIDPDKLSSTDIEDEEMTDGSNSEKRSPSKRQRSPSNDSSSSVCSKASGSIADSESSYSPMAEDNVKLTQHAGVSNSEDCTVSSEKIKLPSDRNTKVVTSEQLDSSVSSKPLKNNPSSVSTTSSSSSSCVNSTSGLRIYQCPMAKAYKQPPVVFLPKLVYDIITCTDSSGLSKSSSFLPHCDVAWASSFRPLLSKMMTCTEQSLYYRQWTVPKASHMDYGNVNEGRMDTFHPRRLLLSGPPQVGKTGAYLQFLSVLSRMLIRLTEVDVYDEEEININLREKPEQNFHQTLDTWPSVDIVKKMDFDYMLHDPKYEDASIISSDFLSPSTEDKSTTRKIEDLYVQRPTTRMRLSKYASYNTYHHCEQCHQYMGYNPRFQMYESTLHAFAFSYSMLGEEIQLHFIIPKSKEHHFVFSQPGGQLESMRLPLVSDKSSDCVKSPIFTPTTGRHEHGLFNLYHAMDGSNHLHILVVKEYEMAIYKKYWPNHIMLVLPSIFNTSGVGAAHFLIKELSYHNLELERNRQAELGVQPQDVWPFIVIADDSCVMWNTIDVSVTGDHTRDCSWAEKNVSLKYILQHMEGTQNITQYAMLGMRKWSSKSKSRDLREPFSRCHLHDFLLLNVDVTQDVQYNQNRFTCDDVDFNLRVNSSGLLICRFNRFSVMKKQITVGGHRSLHIKPKALESSASVSPAHYICAPDSNHTVLAAPAHLLLEKFLQFHSQRFFPLSVTDSSHPVLVVDCYLNLGPQITVCYVSSRPHSVNVNCTGVRFSGLLLHLCDSFVVASFLKKFQFLKDATLCVVCQDRSSLRQTVVRLELEDEWQFRLRDEFQTANAKEDKPLFILTGRHV